MADILISKFTTQIPRVGATPATPGFAESEGQDPVAPSGTPQVYTPVTIGSPANGLSISGTQVLTIGLASTSATGALSSTDWNTFNNKLNLTSPITGYTVGANTALADTDTILQAFGKVQGQINARISGTIASGQVAFGTGVNTVGGSANLTYINAQFLTIGGTTSNNGITLNGSSSFIRQIIYQVDSVTRWIQNVNQNNFSISRYNASGAFIDNALSVRLSTGFVGIGEVTNPTNTLDVNGTARIRTISNLGSAATSVLVPSATGVVSLRTATEFLADAGGISGTIASGQVAFGTGVNTVGSDGGLTWDNTNKTFALGGNTTNTGVRFRISHLDNSTVFAGTNEQVILTLINNNNTNNNWSLIQSNSQTNALDSVIGFRHVDHTLRYGDIVFATRGAGGFAGRMIVHNNGFVGIGSVFAPTNTLDVNGTARIRTISNLGSAATSVLVPSATGVVSLRTLAELASDGLGSRWTDGVGFIYRNGLVVIGNTTGVSNSTLSVRGNINNSGLKTFVVQNFSGTEVFQVLENNSVNVTSQFSVNSGTLSGVANHIKSISNTFGTPALRISNVDNVVVADFDSNATGGVRIPFRIQTGVSSFVSATYNLFRSGDNLSATSALRVENLATTVWFDIRSNGATTFNGQLTFGDASNISFNTTTGTKIGTATNQRLAFYGSTPIVKPSGDILTALSNLGLIASPTITQVDQFAVKTTASADQTLPSGVLTILDYDTTLTNNSTATYTVGTTGRITINTTGIYTITAGVVIEADAVTALESAFLGIFRNGDLVAISSINTTIAAGAQSGLSTSTILSLTATDIIDCRALVNSVGGVANGLARRLGTLLGANATQVNSLSITKNSM